MNRLLPFILLAALLSSCQPSQPKQAEALPTDSVMKMLYANIDTHFVGYALLDKVIQATGNRLTGTQSGSLAEKMVFEELLGFGLQDVRYDPFEVVAWQRGELSFAVNLGKGYEDYPAVALAHSPVQADVEGEIIDAGDGLAADFEKLGKAVEGKIVLVNIGLLSPAEGKQNLHRSEKAALAIKAGAKGVIMVNTVEGRILLTGTASSTGELLEVPAICITMEDAENIRNLHTTNQKPAVAHIRMTNHSGPITARNVVATWKGRELPNEKIIIGGHLDCWDLAQGAIDNGLGSFTVVDVARAFASVGQHPRRTVEFVLFMGEEQGLLGSKHYIERKMKQNGLDSIRYMVNLDMTGNPNGFGINGRPEMKEMMVAIGEKLKARDTVFSNTLNEGTGLHSDHQPFLLQGIPILGLNSNLDPSIYKYYHSDGDNFPLVNPNHMKNGAKFTAMALYALADADSIPAKRLNDAETKAFLETHHLKEPLLLRKEWRWEE